MHGIVGQRTLGELAGFYSRVGSDTIDFRFRFSAESPSLLSVAHTVSAKFDTSLSVTAESGIPIEVDRKWKFHFLSTSIGISDGIVAH